MHEEDFQQNWLRQSPAHFHKKSEKGKCTFVNHDICQIIDAARLTPISSRDCVLQFTIQHWDGTSQTPCGTRAPPHSRMKGRTTHQGSRTSREESLTWIPAVLFYQTGYFLRTRRMGSPSSFTLSLLILICSCFEIISRTRLKVAFMIWSMLGVPAR